MSEACVLRRRLASRSVRQSRCSVRSRLCRAYGRHGVHRHELTSHIVDGAPCRRLPVSHASRRRLRRSRSWATGLPMHGPRCAVLGIEVGACRRCWRHQPLTAERLIVGDSRRCVPAPSCLDLACSANAVGWRREVSRAVTAEERLLAYLAINGPAKLDRLSEVLGLPRRECERAVESLRRMGTPSARATRASTCATPARKGWPPTDDCGVATSPKLLLHGRCGGRRCDCRVSRRS